jgi:hypothetical protein
MVDSPGRTLGSAGMMIVLIGLALYAAAGVAIAAAFVVFGITRVRVSCSSPALPCSGPTCSRAG